MFSCGRVAHPKVSEADRYLPCLLYGQVGNRAFIILLFGKRAVIRPASIFLALPLEIML